MDIHGWLARALFAIGVLLIVVGPMVLGAWVIGPGVLIFAIPLFSWFASRGLVHGVTGVAKAASDAAVEEWQGRYYAFDDFQVRVYEDDARLWFALPDVVRAVGWRTTPQGFLATQRHRLRRVEGKRLEVIDVAGLEALLGTRREKDCGRLLLWARREVVRPWEKRRQERLR